MRHRTAAVLVACGALLLLAGCSSSSTPGPGPSSPPAAGTSTPFHPAGVSSTVQVQIRNGQSASAEVGQLVHFAESPDLVTTPRPTDLTLVTYYGDLRTFIVLKPGTVTFDIANYDRHFSCPNGPCAHPNAPLHMTLRVLPGSGRAPHVPAPIGIAPNATTATLHVGQQLGLGAGSSLSYGPGGCADCVTDLAYDGARTVVGVRPGTAQLQLIAGGRTTPLTVTVVA